MALQPNFGLRLIPIVTIINLAQNGHKGLFSIDPLLPEDGMVTVLGDYRSNAQRRKGERTIIPTLHEKMASTVVGHGAPGTIWRAYHRSTGAGAPYYPTMKDQVVRERYRPIRDTPYWESYGCYETLTISQFERTIVADVSGFEYHIKTPQALSRISHDHAMRINSMADFFTVDIPNKFKLYKNATVFMFRRNGKRYLVVESYDENFTTRSWNIYGDDGVFTVINEPVLTAEVFDHALV